MTGQSTKSFAFEARLAGFKERLHVGSAQWRSRIDPSPAWNILFSNSMPEWRGDIERGFGATRHRLSFDNLSPDAIRACDLVVPLTINDLQHLNGLRHLVRNNPLPIPEPDRVALCDDKGRLNEALLSSGFGHLVPTVGPGLAPPYILKKKIDAWELIRLSLPAVRRNRTSPTSWPTPTTFRRHSFRAIANTPRT